MNRLNKLISQYNSDPKLTKRAAEMRAFECGFIAARKMCAVMGKIAQLEGKDAQEAILRVGTEKSSVVSDVNTLPDSIGILSTLD